MANDYDLTPEALAQAVIANPSWARRLGWIRYTEAVGALTGSPPVPSRVEFAGAIAKWQSATRLDVDGILGPITWAAMRTVLAPPGSLTGIVPPGTPPPPDGFDAIVATFGDPRPFLADGVISEHERVAWERQILGRGTLPFTIPFEGHPVTRFHAHRLLVPLFEAVFEEIERLGLQQHVRSWDGIYNFRMIRGSAWRLSLHAFGAAIDLNASTNPLGSTGDMPTELIEVFRHYGFTWGGDFHGRPDPMHFQYATGH